MSTPDSAPHPWRYRLVYQGADGAMALYFTDEANDAYREQSARGGHVESLSPSYWERAEGRP